VNLQSLNSSLAEGQLPGMISASLGKGREWYAVFTAPKNEKSVLKHLAMRGVESFLPTYEVIRSWKNRQRAHIILPLFPRYLFVHIEKAERIKVLQSPGVLNIVGNGRCHIPLDKAEVEFLRSAVQCRKVEPYCEFIAGQKVRIKMGVLEGIIGTLVRKNNSLRFVLTLNLINQHASMEVDADSLESIPFTP